MSQEFLDVLARLVPSEDPQRLDRTARELDAVVQRLAIVLEGFGDAGAQRDILAHLSATTFTRLTDPNAGPRSVKLTPELLEWARNQYTEEEIVAGLREIEATGGLELKDFIHELEHP